MFVLAVLFVGRRDDEKRIERGEPLVAPLSPLLCLPLEVCKQWVGDAGVSCDEALKQYFDRPTRCCHAVIEIQSC